MKITSASLAIVSLITGSSFATDYTWVGGNVNIFDASNWSGAVPSNDGTNINLAAGDRILVSTGNVISNDSGRGINVPVGAEIVMGTSVRGFIDAQVNIAGTGISGSAITAGGAEWGLPQNVRLTGNTTYSTSGGQRLRTDGGPNRLDLNGQALTVGGVGETNFVSTNIQSNGGVINANHTLSVEGDTTMNSGITINVAPNTNVTSWDGRDNRNDAKINLAAGAGLETRKNDRDQTYSNDVTFTGATGVLRPQIQGVGQPEDGTDMRLQVTGSIKGTGAMDRQGNGTLVLSGNNTFSGGTQLNNAPGARTIAASNTAFGTGSITVNSASTIDLSNAGGLEYRDSGLVNDPLGVPNGVNPALSSLHSTQAFDATRFSYTGKINNTSGATQVYTFAKQYDDDGYVEVDGTPLINNTQWDGVATGQISLTPGEHDIRVAVRNGNGGAGPNNGWDRGIGLSTTMALGAATTNNGDYAKLGDTYQVYQPENRSISNAIVMNQDLTLSTEQMHGYKATVSGPISGTANLTVAGDATLTTDELTSTGANTYSGTTTISSGAVFNLGGSHVNASNYIVTAGATYRQTGTLSVGDLSAPGAAADLQFTNNGTSILLGSSNIRLDMFTNIAGSGGVGTGENDQLIVDGSTTIGLGGSLSVDNPNALNTWAIGNTWDLFTWTTAPTGTFSTVSLPALTPGLAWNTSDLYLGGTISIVPESSSAMLALAGLGLAVRRRRR